MRKKTGFYSSLIVLVLIMIFFRVVELHYVFLHIVMYYRLILFPVLLSPPPKEVQEPGFGFVGFVVHGLKLEIIVPLSLNLIHGQTKDTQPG